MKEGTDFEIEVIFPSTVQCWLDVRATAFVF